MLSSQLEGGFGTLSLEVMKLTSLPVTPSPPSHKMASLRRPYIDKPPLGVCAQQRSDPSKENDAKMRFTRNGNFETTGDHLWLWEYYF